MIRKFWDISIGHIKEDTLAKLAGSSNLLIGQQGALVYIEDEEFWADLPPEIVDCFKAAPKGVDYLLFDSDAPFVDNLPNYDW